MFALFCTVVIVSGYAIGMRVVRFTREHGLT